MLRRLLHQLPLPLQPQRLQLQQLPQQQLQRPPLQQPPRQLPRRLPLQPQQPLPPQQPRPLQRLLQRPLLRQVKIIEITVNYNGESP